MYILFEHATGYGLFKVNQFEEIASNLPQLQDNLADYTKFVTIVKFIAFAPFKSATNALDNINSISEGILHEDLYLFLDTNLPKVTKSGVTKNVDLGVADAKLATSIAENGSLGANCVVSGPVPDLMRGIRQHFTKITKVISDVQESKAQLGLAHSYSRAKVKFNVNRVDNMIIQSIAILDQLDKDINKFAMRLREWYSYHYPELYKLVPDNILYAKVVNIIKNRKELAPDTEEKLEELLSDSSITQAIIKTTKSSMGMDISPLDLNMICKFTNRVIGLGDFKQTLVVYLQSKMNSVAPNLAELLGESVGARLISHAGSLSNLAKCPASTIQILGAEKALFRALKTRGNTPKYGLLFHSTFIGRAGPKDKGRISRYLANKCAIASRIDCFSDVAVPIYGKFLKAQVENRLKFLAGDEEPLKNDEVMMEAKAKADEYLANRAAETEKGKKKKKKKQADQPEGELRSEKENPKKKAKRSTTTESALEDEVLAEVMDEESKEFESAQEKPVKKKKKKQAQEIVEVEVPPVVTEIKKKKKNKNKFKVGDE